MYISDVHKPAEIIQLSIFECKNSNLEYIYHTNRHRVCFFNIQSQDIKNFQDTGIMFSCPPNKVFYMYVPKEQPLYTEITRQQ